MQAEQSILDRIQRRQLKWYGHLLRMEDSRLAEEDLPVDSARQEKRRKTATIMEEPGDGLHEEQRHGRGYGGEQTSLAFGNGWTALGRVDPISFVK